MDRQSTTKIGSLENFQPYDNLARQLRGRERGAQISVPQLLSRFPNIMKPMSFLNTMHTLYTIKMIDGINKLVRVSFDSATNRLRCIFSSLPNDVLKQCTASITYGINCDQQFSDLYSNESTGEFVTIPPLELMSDVTEYCFIVTASSNNLTATVRGIFFAIDTTKMNGDYIYIL